MLLTEKYAPYTLNAIIGNRYALDRLEEIGAEWQRGKRTKPILIYGPTGTGKTSAARALAYSNGFELIELSASDYRDGKSLSRLLLPASTSGTLTKQKLLIFLDEIDELSEKFDLGASSAILKLISVSKYPIIFAANDYWDRKIAFLRDKVERVEFKKVSEEEIEKLLTKIAEKEKKQISRDAMKVIAERSGGDVRGAINDLELMLGAAPELIENLGIRNRKIEIFGVLDKIFTSRNFEIARNAAANTDLDIGMLLSWIDENIEKRYSDVDEIKNAYDLLSDASFFLNKAERTNYYGYLRYSSTLASSGVALANNGAVSLAKHYGFPSRIKYMSSTKKYREVINAAEKKLIALFHAHKSYIANSYLPMLKRMIKVASGEEGREATYDFFESRLGVEKEEVDAIESLPYG